MRQYKKTLKQNSQDTSQKSDGDSFYEKVFRGEIDLETGEPLTPEQLNQNNQNKKKKINKINKSNVENVKEKEIEEVVKKEEVENEEEHFSDQEIKYDNELNTKSKDEKDKIKIKPKKYDPYAAAKELRKQREEERNKQIQEREELRKTIKKKIKIRKEKKKKAFQRTKRGQPIMSNILNSLLTQIESEKNNNK